MFLRRLIFRFARFLRAVCAFRQRGVVVLWRLRRKDGTEDAACSFTEPSPGDFRAVLTRNGKPVVHLSLIGIDWLMVWSEEVRAELESNGWYEAGAGRRPAGIRSTPRDVRVAGAGAAEASGQVNRRTS